MATFYPGLIASTSVVLVSEVGDRTFCIAAILAMKHSRLAVFLGAMAANSTMLVLSALLGWITHLIPKLVTHYLSVVLLAVFGLKMLKEGYQMDQDEAEEEMEEAEAEIQKRNALKQLNKKTSQRWIVGEVFLEALMLTFLGEWGDRSQITTIVLAARENVYAVIIGAIIGHSLCTGAAVIGGRFVAQWISVRTVTIVGGIVFLVFAVTAVLSEIQ